MDTLDQLKVSLASRYSIEREIGRGGMATVYLARDLRHGRNVAVKVLNPELGAILGVERFLAEIRVSASLQHPNLLPLFDSGEAEGLLFYVMPFVEGESLRAKLMRERQLTVQEAVHIAVGIASALDYAHRRNVVHRDLKPENILLHEGQPMIADFGIALAVSNAGGARITQTGLSLGTPQYMSPEQATGDRAVDGRSDIYSLGAVLYESLAGEPPHMGGTVQAIIAKVLTEPVPDVRVRRPTVPPHVAAAIERALEKLPADRWPHAQDFAQALQSVSVQVPAGVSTPASFSSEPRAIAKQRSTRSSTVALAVAALALLGTVFGAWYAGKWSATATRRTVRLAISLPPDRAVAPVLAGPGLAFSPDGSRIAYSGVSPAGTQIYVRELNELTPKPIAGTAGGLYPFFSSDNRSLIFYSSRGLMVVGVNGGPPTLITSGQYIGASAAGNQVVIGGGSLAGIAVVPAQGGTPKLITKLDSARSEVAHLWPHVLPDGRTILFTRWTTVGLNEARLAIVDIDGSNLVTLDLPGTSPLGYVNGHVIYVRTDGMLMAAPVDIPSRRVLGPAIPLDVTVAVRGSGTADAALSESGDLVYLLGSLDTQGFLVDGSGTSHLLLNEVRAYSNPRYSPDGRRIAMTINSMSSTDIWIYEIAAKTLTRLTTESGTNDRAEWTRDGKRVLFRTQRQGGYAVWTQPSSGGKAEPLISNNTSVQEASISPDGKVVAVRVDMPASRRDVYIFNMADRKLTPFATTTFDELMPRFSPNGQWIAYVSDESGQYEVYVRAYPDGSGRIQVSEGGGTEPVWSPDGRRLFYRNRGVMMAANVSSGAEFSILSRKTLFEGGFIVGAFHQSYDLAPNGRDFMMFRGSETGRQIFVILNWTDEIRNRLRKN